MGPAAFYPGLAQLLPPWSCFFRKNNRFRSLPAAVNMRKGPGIKPGPFQCQKPYLSFLLSHDHHLGGGNFTVNQQ